MAWSLRKTSSVQYSEDEQKVFEATQHIGPAVLIFAGIGLLALLAWSAGQVLKDPNGTWGAFWNLLGLYVLIGCAAGGVGGLGGFLFGIPRTRDEAAEAIRQGDTAKARRAVLAANTNLERVSDWLTTLLLGATLVQLEPLVRWLSGLGAKLQASPDQALMPIVVVYFLVVGFLGVYLMTRLYLTYSLQLMLKLGLEADEAGVRDSLVQQLDDALSGTDADKVRAALASFDQQKDRTDVKDDAKLNGLVARAAGRLSKDAGADAKAKETLTGTTVSALEKAVKDDAVKKSLQAGDARTDLRGLDDDTQAKVDQLLS